MFAVADSSHARPVSGERNTLVHQLDLLYTAKSAHGLRPTITQGATVDPAHSVTVQAG